jgi:hypothetical protein
MPDDNSSQLAKAVIYEVKWSPDNPTPQKVSGAGVTVQFNPDSLKLTYANENKSGNSPGGSASQYVGSGTTKLAVQLLFDTSQTDSDVRYWTAKIGYFLKPKTQSNQSNKKVPPGMCFEWGSFSFAGVADSMQETLEYFSESGTPLRATIALGISRMDIVLPDNLPAPGQPTPAGQPGTTQLTPTQSDKSVPQMAAASGNSANWKSIAAASGIDDPLHVSAGTMLNINAGASVGVGANVGVSAGIGVGGTVGVGAGGGVGIGIAAGAGASAGGAASVGFSAGLGAGVGFSAGASAGISAGGGISGGIGGGISGGAGISGGIGGGVSAGAGISGGIGAGAGASGGIGGGIGASAGVSDGASARFGARSNAAGGAGGSFGASAGVSAGFGLQTG